MSRDGFECPECDVVASRRHNLVTHMCGRPPKGHGFARERAEQIVGALDAVPRATAPQRRAGVRSTEYQTTGQLTEGHRRTLELLTDAAAVQRTLEMYRDALDGVEVFLRLTDKGLTVLSLDVEGCRSMIGVGARSSDEHLLVVCPPDPGAVEQAVAGYIQKRDSLDRRSVEELFALDCIRHALADDLRLPGTNWLFIHQEWRLNLPGGSGKLDLLAVDVAARQLVIIECKASASLASSQNAAAQADRYADAIWAAREELYPFLGRLLRATAAIYAPDEELAGFELDLAQRPTIAVWWPDHQPTWPPWNAIELSAPGDGERVAAYRAHQSRYRDEVLGVAPGDRPGNASLRVGNTLDGDAVANDPTLNFVDDPAYRHAVRRGEEVQLEGGTLETGRLFHNLMSSMTMCFNLFGSMSGIPAFVDVVQACFDPGAIIVNDVVCEVKPTDALGDRTAFDAIVHYRGDKGRRRFIAVETKYTEPFSPKPYDTDTYRAVTDHSGWFIDGAADRLVGTATNQLWRGLMLASLTEDETGAVGSYAVVTPADDEKGRAAVEAARRELANPERLMLVTIEEIVAAAAARPDRRLVEWAAAFHKRYIIDKPTPAR